MEYLSRTQVITSKKNQRYSIDYENLMNDNTAQTNEPHIRTNETHRKTKSC